MKVLVVDDNIAIQEILKDILIEEGHIVRISGSIDDAVNLILDFRPNAILLDAVVNDEDGIQILIKAHERDKDLDISAVLIKSVNDETPKDNTFIKAVVNKPFKSTDISTALSVLVARKEEERIAAGAKKKKGPGFLSRFGNKKNTKAAPSIAVDDAAIVAEYIGNESPMFGRSYVFFEQEPAKIYDFMNIFKPSDYSIQIISSDNVKAVKARCGQDGIDVITLSANGKGKSMDINALGTLTVYIKNYIREHDNPIILIDNLTDIIDNNGLNHSLVFLHQLITSKDTGKTVSYVVSVDPSILTKKDRNILLGDMSEYSN